MPAYPLAGALLRAAWEGACEIAFCAFLLLAGPFKSVPQHGAAVGPGEGWWTLGCPKYTWWKGLGQPTTLPAFCTQGTSLVLGPLNYLFVHTFNSGKYCLGVFDNGRAGAVPRVQGARLVLVQLFEPFPRAALLKALTCLSVCCNCPQAHCLVALHFETSWCASTVPAAGLGLGQVSRLGMVWGCMRLVYAYQVPQGQALSMCQQQACNT